MLGSAGFSSNARVNRDAHKIRAGVCGQCGLRALRGSKTRSDFLGLSRIMQAKGLAQIQTGVQMVENGISICVSMQAEPVRTVRTSGQHADR